MPRRKLLDIGSWITIAVTLVLFAIALLVEGVPHDLLLEAGVFLVSAKLVIMSYKNALASDELIITWCIATTTQSMSLEERAARSSRSRNASWRPPE